MTKKAYTQPNLTTYGSVEKLTKAQGDLSLSDFLILSNLPGSEGETLIPASGSTDVEGDFDNL
ncbi:MAG: lasso peptide [Cyanobacteria bacterium J06636_28]